MKIIDDELGEFDELPKFLQDRKGQSDGYQVPKGYFQQLPDQVWQQLKPTPSSIPSWEERIGVFLEWFFLPRHSLALASLAVLVVAAWWLLRQPSPTLAEQPVLPMAVRLEDIPDEALQTYVSENIGEFDDQLIIEAHGARQENLPALPKKATPKPTIEEAEEYLDDVIEDIDIADLEALL